MFPKKNLFTILYLIVLFGFGIYVVLDTFILGSYSHVEENTPQKTEQISGIPNLKGDSSNSQNAVSTTSVPEPEITPFPTQMPATGVTVLPSVPNSTTPGNETVPTPAATGTPVPTPTPTRIQPNPAMPAPLESYQDEDITVFLYKLPFTNRENVTMDIYVADIYVSSPEYLKTAFAKGNYGEGNSSYIRDTVANIAKNNDAILAINGDYYSARKDDRGEYSGFVARNGVLYRSEHHQSKSKPMNDLVVYYDGTMEIVFEEDYTAEELMRNGARDIFCFGPGLVQNGEIVANEHMGWGDAYLLNPRTAIGQIEDNHYVFVAVDGRKVENDGVSIYELAQIGQSLGCETFYNLDGGGSTQLWFMGTLYCNGESDVKKHRTVPDIIYIGY